MKRFAAFVLALALFGAPTLAAEDGWKGPALAAPGAPTPAAEDGWKGPALTEIFDQYEETIVYGE